MSKKPIIGNRNFGKTKFDQIVFLSQSGSIPPMPDTRIIETQLDEITCISLDLPEKAKAESQTWTWNPVELYLTNGTHAATINNIKLTLIRAKENSNSYRCYMTFRQDWTSEGWETYDFKQSIEFKNDAGGQLFNWDLASIAVSCGMQNSPMSFMKDIDPVIYDLIKPAGKYWYWFQSWWYKCKE